MVRHSNNSSAVADDLFECVWLLWGIGALFHEAMRRINSLIQKFYKWWYFLKFFDVIVCELLFLGISLKMAISKGNEKILRILRSFYWEVSQIWKNDFYFNQIEDDWYARNDIWDINRTKLQNLKLRYKRPNGNLLLTL